MIFHSTILALVAGSLLVGFMVLYSAGAAVQILRRWDIRSGSVRQLALERKTYLVSTVLGYVFGYQLLSFFLFIFAADQIHTYFVGAMCAAGSLYVNPYGYPVLLVKLVNFLLIGVWLVINHVDNRAPDYPLVKSKYRLFLALVPLILLEIVLQLEYFLRLEPDLITSCCGTLFSVTANALPAGAGPVPGGPTMAGFYAVSLATSAFGIYYFKKGKKAWLFAALSGFAFAVALLGIFSFISAYIYELPTHRCPFCMLQREYGYIGYPLYLTLLGAVITGLSVGALAPFKKIQSLTEILSSFQRRMALVSSILLLSFTAVVTVRILLSNLVL